MQPQEGDLKKPVTGRLGRQPNSSYRSIAVARFRWSLDFVKTFTIFQVSDTVESKTEGQATLRNAAGPQPNWERAFLWFAPVGRSPTFAHRARISRRKTLPGVSRAGLIC